MRTRAVPVVAALAFAAVVVAADGQQLSFDAALQNLSHEDAGVRLRTVRLLEASGYLDAAVPLARLLVDPSNDVQLAAIETEASLFALEPVPRRRRVALFVEVRGGATASTLFTRGRLGLKPVAIPGAVLSGLAAATNDDDPTVRVQALYALGALAVPPIDDALATDLAQHVIDPDPGVRVATALVIGRLRITSAGDSVIYLLNDEHESVRLAAMEALGDLRETRALSSLTEQFAFYEKGRQAVAALRALARIAHPSSATLFEASVESNDAAIRLFAYDGLGRIGDQRAVPRLDESLSTESDKAAQLAVRFALHRLGRSMLGQLIEGLRDRRLEQQCRDYLIELGSSATSELEAYVHAAEAAVRAGIANVLGVTAGAASVVRLDPLRADPDPDVAAAAARAIQRIQLRTRP